MKSKNLTALLFSASLVLLVAYQAAVADEAPSGTINFTETEFGLLLSGETGSGSLIVKGKSYAISVKGAKLGGIGVTTENAGGNVYNLNKIEDFNGLYLQLEAGLTVVDGESGQWIKNDNGVVIHLKTKDKGLATQIGAGGLQFALR